MNINISVDSVAGQDKLRRLMQAMESRTLLGLIGGRLLAYVDRQFKTRGEGRWRALSPLTLLLRKRGGDAPLQDTGRYKQSFVQDTDNRSFVEVGTNLKAPGGASLGLIHEFGTGPYTIRVKRARVLAARTRFGGWLIFGKEVNHTGIPARPVLPTKAVAERLVQDVVDGALERAQQLGKV